MALTADQLTAWRENPAAFPVYMWAHKPRTVFAARVNQSTFTYPASSITFDTVTTGAYGDVKPGMTLCIGTTPGAWDCGRLRLRTPYGGAVSTATQLFFMRASQGDGDGEFVAADNLYITVYDLRLVWATPPYITSEGVIYKDSDIPFSAARHQMPKANAGPDVLKIVPVGTTSATVDFGQMVSTTMSPDYAIASYAWDFKDGTPSTSTSTAPTGVSFPLGHRYISLTVTDTGGNTHTAYALVVVADENDPDLLRGAEITSHIESIAGGSMSINLSIPLSVTDYPDGTEVLVCTKPRSNMDGLSDRQHMIFSGWMSGEDSSVSARRGFIEKRTKIDLLSIAGRLAALPFWPITIERQVSPTSWSQMKMLTLDRLIYHILYWHSNALDRADFLHHNTPSWSYLYGIIGMSVPSGNLWEILGQYAEAQAGVMVCDQYNRLGILPDQQLIPTATQDGLLLSGIINRSTASKLEILQSDFSDIATAFFRHPRYRWVWSEALYYNLNNSPSTSVPAFIVAPGPAPSQGAGEQRITKQVIYSENEYRWREGNRYAARENAKQGGVQISLVSPHAVIHPAELQWVQVTSSLAGGARPRALSQSRMLPVQVRYSYDHTNATRKVSVMLEPEAVGWASPIYIPPTYPGKPQDPILEFPRPTIPDIGLPAPWLNRGLSRIALICGNGLARTTNFGSGSATVWDWIAWTSLSMGNGVKVFTPNAFSYTGGGDVTGWVTNSNDRVLYLNITARTATSKKTFTGGSLNIDSSILNANFVVAVVTDALTGTGRAIRTSDNSTWTEVTYTSGGLSSVYPSCVFVSQRTAGKAWAHGNKNVWVTTNYGVSWAHETAIGFDHDPGYDQIFSPYTSQNPNEKVWFVGSGEHSQTFRRLNGLTVTDIRPLLSGSYYHPYARRNGFSTAAADANKLLLAGYSAGSFKLFYTNNALGTPTWSVIPNTTGMNFASCAISGDSDKAWYLWGGWIGTNGAIAYSPDGGNNILSQVGNLNSFSPGGVYGIAGW